MPSLAFCAPPFINPMLSDFHCRRRGDINDFAAAGQTEPTQAQMTVRTRDNAVFDNVGGHCRSLAGMIVPCLPLFSRLLLLRLRRLLLLLHESWRGRFH